MDGQAAFLKTVHHLAFASGGQRGVAYAGVLQYFKNAFGVDWGRGVPRRLHGVSGCSVGAAFALMITIGFSVSEIVETACKIRVESITRPNVVRLFTIFGLDDGTRARTVLQTMIRNKLGGDGHISFAELRTRTQTELVVSVSDVKRGGGFYMCASTHPDFDVADAVYASMALPPVFAPLTYLPSLATRSVHARYYVQVFLICAILSKLDRPLLPPVRARMHALVRVTCTESALAEQRARDTLLVDGGAFDPFPIRVFPSLTTLGVRVEWNVSDELNTFVDFITRVIYCAMAFTFKLQWDALSPEQRAQTITVPCPNVRTLDLGFDDGARRALLRHGRDAARARLYEIAKGMRESHV